MDRMRVRPVTPELLVDELAERIDALPAAAGAAVRVVVDGPPPARPGHLADALVDPLRLRGRPPLRVSAGSFLRAASLRLEYGRHDPDSYYDDWLDTGGLTRELLDPLGPDGTGRYLPSLWDPELDRATRAEYEQAPDRAVLLLDGHLLLGRYLPVEYTVHLSMSAAALARRSDPELAWTLPAYARYTEEVDPERVADTVVRCDDPRHPALVEEVSPFPGTPRAPR